MCIRDRPMTEAERTDFIRGIRSQTDKLDFLFQALVKTSRLETGVIQLDRSEEHTLNSSHLKLSRMPSSA